MDTKAKALKFLYDWTNRGQIAHIRKGMVEELEQFATEILSEAESLRAAARMKAQSEGEDPVSVKAEE